MEPTFSLKNAMTTLASAEDAESRFFNLYRCFAWAFFDQKAGDRANYRRHAQSAKQVARFILSEHIDDLLQKLANGLPLSSTDEEHVRQFLKFGGTREMLKGYFPRHFARRFKKGHRQTKTVFKIVNYLCRAHKSSLSDRERTIVFAQYFLQGKGLFGRPRTIEEEWQRYAPAAAVIFSTYMCCPTMKGEPNLISTIGEIKDLAEDPHAVRRYVGYAAYANGILLTTNSVKAYREVSFAMVEAIEPPLESFSEDEWSVIRGIKLGT